MYVGGARWATYPKGPNKVFRHSGSATVRVPPQVVTIRDIDPDDYTDRQLLKIARVAIAKQMLEE